jgi:beta-galactosidase
VSIALLCSAFAAAPAARADTNPRERLLMDFGWKFHLGDDWGPADNLTKAGASSGPAGVSYSDASWRTVDLPHDWAIELPFDPKGDWGHGYKALGEGFPENSIGWYRRTFDLPKEDSGKRIWLEFGGVYRDCTVFVNGWVVGRHPSGYSSFRYDITDVVNPGEKNVVAVRVNASRFEGWFYEGAGIYRHVWLVKTAPLAVAPDGTFVYASFPGNVPGPEADIHLEARLLNTGYDPAQATVSWEVRSPGGKLVASAVRSASAAAIGHTDVTQVTQIDAPELWSPETPRLYKLVTTVTSGGQLVDRVETEFGIRTTSFDPTLGFLLNGKPYEIKGTCNHQDHAGVGEALPDGLQYFRIASLKEFGCNAYRTSHNAPTPELLEACDRLGMLVMDENRLLGSDSDNLGRLEQQVRRDRNHPSVVVWSIANEEWAAQETPAGGRVAARMQALVHQLDPTRAATDAFNGTAYAGINRVIDVRGWNYHIGQAMDDFHRDHPDRPNIGTEQASTVGTRGIYANDKVKGYVSAYDDNAPEWGNTAEQWWSFFGPRPWLSGGFAWTGFDYRGEETPYRWPCINSHFGILDTCGFPKDNFWYYKAWWTSEPVLHLLPHWNWAGREGQAIDVRALSNCDEVELFLNGVSLGRQTMKKNSELKWSVPYQPGRLSAKGYRGGVEVADTNVDTTGAATDLQLVPNRAAIAADREDVAVVTVQTTDPNGRGVPTASDHVSFSIDGPGRILGVGNGDPSCHEPDVFIGNAPSTSIPIEGWKIKTVANSYPGDDLSPAGPAYDDSSWAAADVQTENGSLEPSVSAWYRVRFNATAEELASSAVELWFGKVDGGGNLFVNGIKAGDSSDPRAASVFDVKALLHPGENTLAVRLSNWGTTAGIGKGVTLRLTGAPAPVQWSRSLFNGLAQVIVQSTGVPGEIHLKASAPGLAPAELTIAANTAPLRPALP